MRIMTITRMSVALRMTRTAIRVDLVAKEVILINDLWLICMDLGAFRGSRMKCRRILSSFSAS